MEREKKRKVLCVTGALASASLLFFILLNYIISIGKHKVINSHIFSQKLLSVYHNFIHITQVKLLLTNIVRHLTLLLEDSSNITCLMIHQIIQIHSFTYSNKK